jgi:hypothetical protein
MTMDFVSVDSLPPVCYDVVNKATQAVTGIYGALRAVAGNSLSHDGRVVDFTDKKNILCVSRRIPMPGTADLLAKKVSLNGTEYEINWIVPLWRELQDLREERTLYTTENGHCAIYFVLTLKVADNGELHRLVIFTISGGDHDSQKIYHTHGNYSLSVSEDCFFQLTRLVDKVERLTALKCKAMNIYSQWFGVKATGSNP